MTITVSQLYEMRNRKHPYIIEILLYNNNRNYHGQYVPREQANIV